MPITADRVGGPRGDRTDAAAPEDAAIHADAESAGPDGRPAGIPLGGLLGIAGRLRAGQGAATTVEYALMLLLISSLLVAMSAMATSLLNAFGWAARALS